MSDDANDVSKALAAFGAPSIRYHSFGQAQIKPSSVVLPRRVTPATPEGFVTRQDELLAPEPPLVMSAPPPVPVPPPFVSAPVFTSQAASMEARPAPIMRQPEPLAPIPPLPDGGTAAKAAGGMGCTGIPPAGMTPPRPAAVPIPVRPLGQPATSMPSPPLIVPPSFPSPAQPPMPTPGLVAQRVAPPLEVMTPPPSVSAPPLPVPPPPVAAAPRAPIADDETLLKKNAASAPRRNLEEIFELLAGV